MNNAQIKQFKYEKERWDVLYKYDLFGCFDPNNKTLMKELDELDKRYPEESKIYKGEKKSFT